MNVWNNHRRISASSLNLANEKLKSRSSTLDTLQRRWKLRLSKLSVGEVTERLSAHTLAGVWKPVRISGGLRSHPLYRLIVSRPVSHMLGEDWPLLSHGKRKRYSQRWQEVEGQNCPPARTGSGKRTRWHLHVQKGRIMRRNRDFQSEQPAPRSGGDAGSLRPGCDNCCNQRAIVPHLQDLCRNVGDSWEILSSSLWWSIAVSHKLNSNHHALSIPHTGPWEWKLMLTRLV